MPNIENLYLTKDDSYEYYKVSGSLKKTHLGFWIHDTYYFSREELISKGVNEELLALCSEEPQIVKIDLTEGIYRFKPSGN